jgi:hypothetical protein
MIGQEKKGKKNYKNASAQTPGIYRYFLEEEFMNLMHSSTASLLCESSTTTTGAAGCCRLLLFLAGVHSGEAADDDVLLFDADRNAMRTLALARR